MATTKKKQEEEHLKILREMVALPHNKHCFDCHQRGPTYINMTIGSFICTSCSGLLRGLNPPHRVKSISMASFSVEEMDFIRRHGNEYCRKVWLGLYDSRMSLEIDTKDENRMREAMSQRYDRKRWYVQPTSALEDEALRMNETSATAAKSGQSKPLTSLVGSNVPALSVQADKPSVAAGSQVQSVQRPLSSQGSSVQPAALTGFTAAAAATLSQPITQTQPKPASVDLLADFSSDSKPFQQQQQQQQQQPQPPAQADAGFANFASFANQSIPVPQQTSSPTAQQQKPAGAAPLMPLQSSAGAKLVAPPQSTSSAQPVPADKYSALADLESVFSTTSISSFSNPGAGGGFAVNWDGNSRPPGGGVQWGGSTTGPVMSGGFGVGSSAMAPAFGTSPPPPSYANLATAAVPNPFGPTVAAPQPVVGMQSHFMPMSTTGSYGFYGQPQAAASSQPAQVAMFGAQPQIQPSVQNGSTTGMFGAAQFSMQNGMPISASAPAYMRPSSAPQAVPTQQPVAFGAWSQPTPVANPFLVQFTGHPHQQQVLHYLPVF